MNCFQLLKSEYFLVSFLIFDSKHNIFGQDILGCHFRVWKKTDFSLFSDILSTKQPIDQSKKKKLLVSDKITRFRLKPHKLCAENVGIHSLLQASGQIFSG